MIIEGVENCKLVAWFLEAQSVNIALNLIVSAGRDVIVFILSVPRIASTVALRGKQTFPISMEFEVSCESSDLSALLI
jgi:hypothetical protein